MVVQRAGHCHLCLQLGENKPWTLTLVGGHGGTSPAALAQLWLAQQWVALHTHLCSAPSEHQCHSPDTILCPLLWAGTAGAVSQGLSGLQYLPGWRLHDLSGHPLYSWSPVITWTSHVLPFCGSAVSGALCSSMHCFSDCWHGQFLSLEKVVPENPPASGLLSFPETDKTISAERTRQLPFLTDFNPQKIRVEVMGFNLRKDLVCSWKMWKLGTHRSCFAGPVPLCFGGNDLLSKQMWYFHVSYLPGKTSGWGGAAGAPSSHLPGGRSCSRAALAASTAPALTELYFTGAGWMVFKAMWHSVLCQAAHLQGFFSVHKIHYHFSSA